MDTGENEFRGGEPIKISNFGSIGVLTPGSQNYEIRLVKNGSPLADGLTFPVNTDSSTTSIPILAFAVAANGDQFRYQIRNIDGEDDVTIVSMSSDNV